jgi:hypothetical protein
VTEFAVEHNSRVRCGWFARFVVGLAGVLKVRRVNSLLDDLNELLERDVSFALHETQHAQVNVH